MQEFVTIPTYLIEELKDKPYSKLGAYIDILNMAEEGGGEFETTRRTLESRWGWSGCKVNSFLSLLEEKTIIRPNKNQKKTTITLVNSMVSSNTETKEKPKKDQRKTKVFTSKMGKKEAYQMIVDTWNELSPYGIEPISIESISRKQEQSIADIAKEYGVEDILKTIQRIKKSDFLQGKSERGWKISFNWLLNMGKYEKVRGSEYDGRVRRIYENKTAQMLEQHYAMTAEWVKEMEEKENDNKGIWSIDGCDKNILPKG